MMAAQEEEAILRRTIMLAEARRLCCIWGYWCARTHVITGYEPFMNTGGVERNYKAKWQYDTPEPFPADPNEPLGLDVQKAFAVLPKVYRFALIAEYCFRPWVVVLKPEKIAVLVAKKARLREDNYQLTLERALLALVNVMKRKGLWRE